MVKHILKNIIGYVIHDIDPYNEAAKFYFTFFFVNLSVK